MCYLSSNAGCNQVEYKVQYTVCIQNGVGEMYKSAKDKNGNTQVNYKNLKIVPQYNT